MTIASRIAVVNTTTTAATVVRRAPGIRPGRSPRWPFRRASRAGHAGRGDERHGQRAYQDGPSGQNRQGPVSTAAATTAISVESVMAVRAPSAAMDAQARFPSDVRPRRSARRAGPRIAAVAPTPALCRHSHRPGAARAGRDPAMDLSGGRGLVALAARPSRPGRPRPLRSRRSRLRRAAALRRYRQYGESGVGPASRRLAILGLAATLGAQELAEGLDAAEAEWLQRVSRIDPATLPRAVRGSIPTGWTSVCPPWTARTR